MDIITLVTTAFTLASPYLVKTGEALAEKAGESIWDVIKKPFERNGREITKEEFLNNQELLKVQLSKELEVNDELKKDLEKTVQQAQTMLNNNLQQNLNNYGEIQKQINIQNNSGNITM